MLSCFTLEAELKGHEGCVNTVNWNADGSLLASGSDEGTICLWSYPDHQQRLRFDSGHEANVFSAQFLPWRPAHDAIVSCSADATVRLHTIREGARGSLPRCGSSLSCSSRGGVTTEVVLGHHGRVKKLAVDAEYPQVVLSASDDGTVGVTGC